MGPSSESCGLARKPRVAILILPIGRILRFFISTICQIWPIFEIERFVGFQQIVEIDRFVRSGTITMRYSILHRASMPPLQKIDTLPERNWQSDELLRAARGRFLLTQ